MKTAMKTAIKTERDKRIAEALRTLHHGHPVPPYRIVLTRALSARREARPAPGRGRLLVPGLVAAALAAALVAVWGPERADSGRQGTPTTRIVVPSEVVEMASWQAPTDLVFGPGDSGQASFSDFLLAPPAGDLELP